MIEFDINNFWLRKAQKKSDELGQLKRSITKGRGNLAGFLGEYIAQNVMGGVLANTYDYDLLINDCIKVDVKSKLSKVKPLPHYSCSVADYYLQNCDYYAFVRIKTDLTKGWFLGIKQHDDLLTQAKRVKKGDYDADNNFYVRLDGYSIKIKDLDSWTSLQKHNI